MTWMPIESAPQDGTPIAYPWRDGVISTCAWMADADEPGWWDLRAEEPAFPVCWAAIVAPATPAGA